jgi:hypothetical protein
MRYLLFCEEMIAYLLLLLLIILGITYFLYLNV